MKFPFHNIMRMAQIIKICAILIIAIFIILSGIVYNGMVLSGEALGSDIERNVIIGFNKPVGPSEKALIQGHGGTVKKSYHIIKAIAARVPESNITKMKRDPRIVYIEDDKIYEAADEYINSPSVTNIGSDIVHSQGIIGTGVKIAILDTGIDYSHIDLKNNYKGGTGFVQDIYGNVNSSNYDDSTKSHGTHVAGIIAAENNGIGVIGVAPGADIYAIKVLDGAGFGSSSWIISGIQWAIDNNVDIITMSIQGADSQALHDAVDVAYNLGILVVAAGGNTNGGSVRYPAAYDSVIAVTAVNDMYQKASFSPIGPEVELAAQGVDIYSTIRDGYGYNNGTSMATPHVTSVAALILSTDFQDIDGNGIKNNSDVRIIMQNTAKDVGDVGKDNIYGYGLIDASNALLGISAYIPADLSVVKDDGVSTVVAGDGEPYTYTIKVKNNGPSNAYNVKVTDIWPSGFIRSTISGSGSGNCDTTNKNNFSCIIGSIANGDTETINVTYSVPLNLFEMGLIDYINKVYVISNTIDADMANNAAIDTNIVNGAKLRLIRTKGSPINDLRRINLSQGNYYVNIHSDNISEIEMKVYENGKLRKDLSSVYNFNKTKDISLELAVRLNSEVVFVPYGSKGSTGYVTIRRL